MRRRLISAAAVVTFSLLLTAAPAHASGADVILDCNDNGRLTREYSQAEYRDALRNMPADVKQYTDCEGIIRRAQLGLPLTGGTANDPFAGATPAEIAQAQKDIRAAVAEGAAPQEVGGRAVIPGALAYTKVSAATSELPTPLVVLIVLILLASLVAARPFTKPLLERVRSLRP